MVQVRRVSASTHVGAQSATRTRSKLKSLLGRYEIPKRQFADGCVARVNDDGRLGFATFYGGSTRGPEGFFGPAIDAAGNVYVTGRYRSTDLVVTNDAFQRRRAAKGKDGPPLDAVLVVFNSQGQLRYATYFGGSGTDGGRYIAIDSLCTAVYLVGETTSPNLPLLNPLQSTSSGAFIAKFAIKKHSN